MPEGVESHVLQKEFGIYVVEIDVPDLYDDPRNLGEEYAHHIGIGRGALEVGQVQHGTSGAGAHSLEGREQAAFRHGGSGEHDSILHQLAYDLEAVHEVVGIVDLGGGGRIQAQALRQQRSTQTVGR